MRKVIFLTTILAMTLGSSILFASPKKAIQKEWPGFKVLTKKELAAKGVSSEIRGRFNDDKSEDYAAFIRSPEKLSLEVDGKKATAYDGMLVVCHAGEKKTYTCMSLFDTTISIPFKSSLKKMKPGKVTCSTTDEGDLNLDVPYDSIGIDTGKEFMQYIYQRDGRYRSCVVKKS